MAARLGESHKSINKKEKNTNQFLKILKNVSLKI